MKKFLLFTAVCTALVYGCTKDKSAPIPNTYTFKAADGHLIGVNGVKPDGKAQTGGCKADHLDSLFFLNGYLNYRQTYYGGDFVQFHYGRDGADKIYADGNSTYTLYPLSTGTILMPCGANIFQPNSIMAVTGNTYFGWVEVICMTVPNDTAGCIRLKSNVLGVVVPQWNCNTADKKGGKKK